MDTITTIQDLSKCNGSALPVMVALTQSDERLIAAAPTLVEAGLRYFAAMDKLRDASVQSLSRDDPRFTAVADTRVALRAALLQAAGGENGR